MLIKISTIPDCFRSVFENVHSPVSRRTCRPASPGTSAGTSSRSKISPNSISYHFSREAGVSWSHRYERHLLSGRRFNFVELDYRRASVLRSGAARRYETADANIHEDVRELMDAMLYGAPAQLNAEDRGQLRIVSIRWEYTGPYEYLSPWACFFGLKTLQWIHRYLESGRPIR